MKLTLEEIKEDLKQLDELTLLEKLDITSEELVEVFLPLISDEKYTQLMMEYEDDAITE